MKPQLISSLKTYKKKDIVGDLLAGLMVAIIALPLSIALGIQSVPTEVSSNGIQFGIITAIVAGFFISALGGSRFQIGGPTAAFVVILYGYLADPDIGLLGLAIAAIMAGVLLIIMGLCKCGSVMKFFPYPITIGFTTGIGITLFIGQIKDFCGLTNIEGTEVIEKLISYGKNIASFDLPTFFIGITGFACVTLLPTVNKKIPAAFVALIICTVITLLFNTYGGMEIATIGSEYGDIKAGFFPIDLSGIASVKFTALILPAIVIAFLCAIESLLSATVASGMTNTAFDANQELIGQGVANIASSLLGGLPATGAIARTAAGIENGAKSPLAGMFHAVFVLIMYFALMKVMQFIPLAVFAAILMSVAINMSRFGLFARLAKFGARDTSILIFTCALTVAKDLVYGVIGGVILTVLVNVKNFKIGISFENDDGDDDATVKLKGTLFFVNANKLVSYLQKRFDEGLTSVTLDLTELSRIDETALEKLAALNKSLVKQGKSLSFINANEKTKKRMDKFFSIL